MTQKTTLDAKHLEMLTYFKELKKSVPKLEIKRKKLQKELESIKSNRKKTKKVIPELLNSEEKLLVDINKLDKKIKDIKESKEENEYFLKTQHILFDYYHNLENTKSFDNKTPDEKNNTISSNKKMTIMDFLKNNKVERKKNMKDFVQKKENFKRGDLLNEFMSIIDSSYTTHKKKITSFCPHCKDEMSIIPSEGVNVCVNCGYMEFTIVDSEKPSYKEPPPEINYFAYKRINHYNEWLSQFQAKETTEIPTIVLDNLRLEIKKARITNMKLLTYKMIRKFLKKLDSSKLSKKSIKYSKYYEHIPHIINRLNGVPPLSLTREMEEKLRIMFKEIQAPFIKHCPKNRKNFLSYSYILHKFCELLELDQYLHCFPYLKSREKLQIQDNIWKKICKELNWQFIKSI